MVKFSRLVVRMVVEIDVAGVKVRVLVVVVTKVLVADISFFKVFFFVVFLRDSGILSSFLWFFIVFVKLTLFFSFIFIF